VPHAIDPHRHLATFTEHYAPRVIGHFNGQQLMVAKLLGAFQWHVHDDTDDFFYVLHGRLRIETEHGDVDLEPGQIHVVPRGVRHRPVAEAECHVLLIEREGASNTGDPATSTIRRAS